MNRANKLHSRFFGFLVKLWLELGAGLFVALTIAIGSLLFFAWLTNQVLEGDTKIFDENVREWIHRQSFPALTAVMQTATIIGSTLVLTILGAILMIVFLCVRWKRAAVLFLITMAGAIILNFSLKGSFARTRPIPYFETPLPASYSFPSGHALFALCFYGIITWLITSRIKNRGTASLIWLAALPLILLIGISRIYLGVHFPSDVIAGYAAGFIWIVAVALGDFWFKRSRDKKASEIVSTSQID